MTGERDMDRMATARVLRFPQGVSRYPQPLVVRWRRGAYYGARAALLDLPGAAIFALPRRATATGKRIWTVVCHTGTRRLAQREVYLCVSRAAVRDIISIALQRLGWEAVL